MSKDRCSTKYFVSYGACIYWNPVFSILNGYLVGSSTTSTAISVCCVWSSTFGLRLYNGSYYDGYIDEFRFSTSARYTLPVGVSLQDDVNGY